MNLFSLKLARLIVKITIFLSVTTFTTLQFAKIGSYLNENNIDPKGNSYLVFQANLLRFSAITVDTHSGKKSINGIQEAIISEFYGVYALYILFMECSLLTFAGYILLKLAIK